MGCARLITAGMMIALAVTPAAAASPVVERRTATCATLQSKLDEPSVIGRVEIQVTSPECTDAGYTLPPEGHVSIVGAPTRFVGLDHPVRVFGSNDPSGVDGLALSDMTIIGPPALAAVSVLLDGPLDVARVAFVGQRPEGTAGGLEVRTTGATSDIRISDSSFRGLSSHAGGLFVETGYLTGASSSTILVERNRFEGNRAFRGGGAYIRPKDGRVELRDNAFLGNHANSMGGGAVVDARAADVVVSGNVFRQNKVIFRGGDASDDRVGGGLALFVQGAGSVRQAGNVFDSNVIAAERPLPDFTDFRGGGEFIQAKTFVSRDDKFSRNALPAPEPSGRSEGAGLAIEPHHLPSSPCAGGQGSGENLVAAGNTIAGAGRGAGISVGCPAGTAALVLTNSTVAGNATGPGGVPGIAGVGANPVTLRNTILAASSPGVLAHGVRLTTRASYLCPRPGARARDACDPRLVDASTGDVRQTAASPTWDAGASKLVPPTLATDAFGAARIQGSSVDIGAHERRGRIDRRAPRIGLARLARRRFAVPPGTRLRLRVSERGIARLVFRGPRGKRVGSFRRRVRVGSNRIRIRHAGARPLKPGRYRLTVTVADSSKNRSRPRRLRFRVLPR